MIEDGFWSVDEVCTACYEEACETAGIQSAGTAHAGKSTLVKVISGIQPPDEGEAYFEGEPVRLRRPQDAASLGIATVYQDLALCDNLDVVANLFLGREAVASGPPSAVRLLDQTHMQRRSRELLDSLHVTTLGSVRTEVGSLSGGQRARQRLGSAPRCARDRLDLQRDGPAGPRVVGQVHDHGRGPARRGHDRRRHPLALGARLTDETFVA